MYLFLLRASELRTATLPEKISGQHPVVYTADNGQEELLLSVNAQPEGWTVWGNDTVSLEEKGENKCLLSPGSLVHLRRNNGEEMLLYAQEAEIGFGCYYFYRMPHDRSVSVGADDSNDICYRCAGINAQTLSFVRKKDRYSIFNQAYRQEYQLHKGYLNHMMISRQSDARPGDVLSLFGLRILLGRDFIAVNVPRELVHIRLSDYRSMDFHPLSADKRQEKVARYEELFSSAPRVYHSQECRKFVIETPPAPENGNDLPWIIMVGPALTMSAGTLLSSIMTMQNLILSGNSINSALPSLVMALVMVTGSALWPTLGRKIQDKRRMERAALADEDYRNYLKWVSAEIQKTAAQQKGVSDQNNPSLRACISRIYKIQPSLWERSPHHKDFLEVMIGRGSLPLNAEFRYPDRSYSSQISPVTREMYSLMEHKYIVQDVPITVPFANSGVIGLIGERQEILYFVRALVIELTALHNYQDLRLAFIYDPAEEKKWRFAKWVPHVWDEGEHFRCIATTPSELKKMSGYLQAHRHEANTSTEKSTHYVIFAGSRELAERSNIVTNLYDATGLNMTVVALYDKRQYLPKRCRYVIDLGHGHSKATVVDLGDESSEPLNVNNYIRCPDDPEDLFIHMSQIRIRTDEQQGKFPDSYTMIEMCGVGRAEHIDLLSSWRNSDPVDSLNAQIGIDRNGYPVGLDIHEKAHGPHGLIAGMTGSGKSEFIISYIASMAIRYSPENVAFVLIDFKGGGMADVFRNLPHTAGLITNLDGNELKRSFMAIESELQKRQKLFKQISEQKKISNIDIYKYQKLRRTDQNLQPLPHLILISDEFAELKQQHRDFMEQLIRIARIGRSLGVHLILATQKPDGIVDDQIKSNIRFKVCLKVQDRSDSKTMIGRSNAADITAAGRFYLQVGNDEVFEQGQSPWSGALYEPSETAKQNICNEIELIDRQGLIVLRETVPPAPRKVGTPEKQIDAIVDYISKVAKQNHIQAQKLWLNPLDGPEDREPPANAMDLEVQPFVLNPIIGLYDDLRNQRHVPLTVPFTAGGNTLLYGAAGTGTLAFINAMLVTLLSSHSPRELSLYLLDYDSGSLSAFEKAPHTLIFAGANNVGGSEKTVVQLLEELKARKRLLQEYGGDYRNYLSTSGKTLPNLLLIIHNYQNFSETVNDARTYISALAREGTQYGIYVFLSGTTANSIPYTLQPLFHNVYTLQQNSEEQYREILGKTGGIQPQNYHGRGLVRVDGTVCEFQTKLVFPEAKHVYNELISFCRQLWEKYQVEQETKKEQKVYDWPAFQKLRLQPHTDRLPVGLDPESGEIQNFSLHECAATLLLYSDEQKSKYAGILKLIRSSPEEVTYFGINPIQMRLTGWKAIRPSQFGEEIEELWEEVLHRAKIGTAAKEQNQPLPDFPYLIYVLDSISTIFEWLPDVPHQHLVAMLQGLSPAYHVHFLLTDHVAQTGTLLRTDCLQRAVPFDQGLLLCSDPAAAMFFHMENSEQLHMEGDNFSCLIRNGRGERSLVITDEKGDEPQ